MCLFMAFLAILPRFGGADAATNHGASRRTGIVVRRCRATCASLAAAIRGIVCARRLACANPFVIPCPIPVVSQPVSGLVRGRSAC